MRKLTDEELAGLSPEQRAQYETHIETFGDPEEKLDPELEKWCEDTTFGKALKHPLVFSIPLMPGTYGMMNKALRVKREKLEEFRAEQKWSSFIFMHERAYRMYAFSLIEADIEDDATYWDVLGSIWTDSENIWQEEESWGEYLSSERTDRDHLMDEDERKAFAKLPETITIHRGYKRGERKMGMSWTISRPQAEWFARRLAREDDESRVVSGTLPKAKALAYFTGRGESEIVAFPEDITVTSDRKVRNKANRNPATRAADELLAAGNTPKAT
jgi:hypothetical protein